MTMYCIAGLSMMHMLLHVESECDIHDITRGRRWRNNTITINYHLRPRSTLHKSFMLYLCWESVK